MSKPAAEYDANLRSGMLAYIPAVSCPLNIQKKFTLGLIILAIRGFHE